MFHLHLQYQGVGATAQQFGNLNPFGGGGSGVPVANDVTAQFGNLVAFGWEEGGNAANNDNLFLEPFHRR